ncbi:homeobox domain, ZF-HD class protein [Medicago truncatula]|uniref:Homeobox domain, ZF-HD class protein n=1 Tax=Medicago truncatula TaxID=3880 RepID=G7LJC2_MEDTR|nr:homeobox domain, ZF-HD class protein [Medicago truncatula]
MEQKATMKNKNKKKNINKIREGGHILREDLEQNVHHVVEPINGGGEGSSQSKKRFRSRFTHEQREKMLDFAGARGWKIQKRDENVVKEFRNEIGVKLQVFKAWVQNNKHTLGKKP